MSLLIPAAAALVASFVNTLTGFGFALIALPVLVATTDAKSAVVLTMLLYSALAPPFFWSARRDVDPSLLKVLLLSSLLGQPLGTMVLVAIDEHLLRTAVAVAILIMALLLALDYHRPFRHRRRAGAIVGFATGVLATSIVVSGPLVVLFLANEGMPKERLRATAGIFMLGMMPVTFGLYLYSGLITLPLLGTAVRLIPALLVGYLLATRAVSLVDPKLFRRLTLLLVLGAGLTLLASQIRSLFPV